MTTTARTPVADLPDVMTYADLSAFTGITVGALHTRAHAGALPAPDGRMGATPYWMRETIQRWAPGGQVPRQPRSDRGVPRGPRRRTAA